MARKKGSFDEWAEPQDEAAVEAEVTDDGYDADEPVTVEPTLKDSPRVKLKDAPKAKEPEISDQTKAEMATGKKTVEEKEKAQKDAEKAAAKNAE